MQVVPTRAALAFVGSATWEALSGRPVHTDVWQDVPGVEHVALGRRADLVLVAPATADLLARAANGNADDLLTATLLTATCPVLMAPAMHTEMWQHPATRANVAVLRRRGAVVLEPASGRLTGSDTGVGRLPEPEALFQAAVAALHTRGSDLAGMNVVISAGGTREPLDPVRFLGNRSSGRQGWALAAAAAARGARVTLIAANVALAEPAGVTVERVGTARELDSAVRAAAHDADAVVMAAAVADFRPASELPVKIKKDDSSDGVPPAVALVRNPDILAGLVAARELGDLPTSTLLVGFAAETGDADGGPLEHARAKFGRRRVDLLVANDVSDGAIFGQTHNTVHLITKDGEAGPVTGSKQAVAHAVWDCVMRLGARATLPPKPADHESANSPEVRTKGTP